MDGALQNYFSRCLQARFRIMTGNAYNPFYYAGSRRINWRGLLDTFCFIQERPADFPVDFRYEIAPPRLIDYSGEMILTVGKYV